MATLPDVEPWDNPNGSAGSSSVDSTDIVPVEPSSRVVGTTTISSATGAAFGTYLAILVVQLFGLESVLDMQGVQALSGVLAIIFGIIGGWIAPPKGA